MQCQAVCQAVSLATPFLWFAFGRTSDGTLGLQCGEGCRRERASLQTVLHVQ